MTITYKLIISLTTAFGSFRNKKVTKSDIFVVILIGYEKFQENCVFFIVKGSFLTRATFTAFKLIF